MSYKSDEEEMVPERLVEVAHAIVEFHVPGIYVSAPGQASANSYTEYGLIAIENTVHTINVCLVWFFLGAATSSSPRSSVAVRSVRSANASWTVSHQFLVSRTKQLLNLPCPWYLFAALGHAVANSSSVHSILCVCPFDDRAFRWLGCLSEISSSSIGTCQVPSAVRKL